MSDVRTLVGHLAQVLGRPVLLEDAHQQPMAHSAHDDVSDTMREASILRQSTGQDVVDRFAAFDLPNRVHPFVIAADADSGTLARLCIPLRYGSQPLGYAWALLPGGAIDLPLAMPVGEAIDHLRLAMVAQVQARGRESATLMGLLSTDPDERADAVVGLQAHRFTDDAVGLRVIVCTGPWFRFAAAGSAFWSAAWAPDISRMLRAADDTEGIALIPADAPAPTVARARQAHRQVARACGSSNPGLRAAVGLGIGVSDVAADLSQASGAHRRARMAARVALVDPHHFPVAEWDSLGVYRMLSEVPSRGLREAVDPRVAHLAADRPTVAATVETYLDLAGAVSQTAEALHIHRTTLYYRLEQATTAGLDLADGRTRLTAHAGLKALRLLGEWSM